MENLAYTGVVLAIIAGGIWLNRYLRVKYEFSIFFSYQAILVPLITVAIWILAYFYYKPGTADALWIEVAAGLLVLILGVVAPFWLLLQDIRGSNFFWGLLAFIYQFLVVSTVVLLVLIVILRLMDSD